jgi:hypothetical protein
MLSALRARGLEPLAPPFGLANAYALPSCALIQFVNMPLNVLFSIAIAAFPHPHPALSRPRERGRRFDEK